MDSDRRSVWAVSLILALGFVLNYIDRGNISVAAPLLQREFRINPTRLGVLFSAFVFSYAVMQIPAGYLVDRFNVKWLYAAAFVWWSVANAAIALAGGFLSLLILRMLLSIGESISLPASSKILASTFVEHERGIANGILDSGYKFGPAIGVIVGGIFIAHYGWRLLFLVTGFGALLWLIPWFWIADSTADSKRPQPDATKTKETHALLSIKEILCSTRAWGTFIGNFCGGYVWYLMLSWMPSYLVTERHMNLAKMGVFGSLLFVVTGVTSILSGLLTDRMIRRGRSSGNVRLGFMVAGLLLSTFLVPAGFASTSGEAMAFLLLTFAAYGMYSCNVWAATQSIAGAPNIGRWSGIQNLIGNLGGVASPALTGWIVTVTGSFHWAFVVAAVVMVLGALVYVLVVKTLDPIRSVRPSEI
jgi:ACS family D-galactonate transporter-like MFS transporter